MLSWLVNGAYLIVSILFILGLKAMRVLGIPAPGGPATARPDAEPAARKNSA